MKKDGSLLNYHAINKKRLLHFECHDLDYENLKSQFTSEQKTAFMSLQNSLIAHIKNESPRTSFRCHCKRFGLAL